MNFRIAVFTAALALAPLASPVMAQSDADRAAVAERMDGLLALIEGGDFGGTFDTLPPPILQAMADQNGISADQLKEMAAAMMSAMAEQIRVDEMSYDLDAAKWGTSSTGRQYAVIPTVSVIDMGSQKIRVSGDTVALVDEGAWYLLRMEGPEQFRWLGRVYPDLAGLEIGEPQMDVVE